MQRKGYVAKTIGIKLRYEDFKIATRDQTLPAHTADAARIRHVAGQCLKRVPLDQRLRLLGVRASTLARPGQELENTQKIPVAQSPQADAVPEKTANRTLF